jgi:integrase
VFIKSNLKNVFKVEQQLNNYFSNICKFEKINNSNEWFIGDWEMVKEFDFENILESITDKTLIHNKSEILSKDEINTLIDSFKKMGNFRMSLLIEFGVKTLLRYSDLNTLRWVDIIGKDKFIFNQKSSKKRLNKKIEITIDDVLKMNIETTFNELNQPNIEDLIFKHTIQHTNMLLREIGKNTKTINKRVSTHSLRKSGSKLMWQNNNCSLESLKKLSSILNHSSTYLTREYLEIDDIPPIKNIYKNYEN